MSAIGTSRFEAIREEMERVRLRFLDLLDKVSEKEWNRRLPGEGWTIKQEMVHIVQVLKVIPTGIRRASTGRTRSPLAIVPTRSRFGPSSDRSGQWRLEAALPDAQLGQRAHRRADDGDECDEGLHCR